MLKRILSALVGIAILVAIYTLKNDVVYNIAVVLISLIGLNEFYHAIRKIGFRPMETPGYLCCLLLGTVGFVNNEKVLLPIVFLLMPILLIVFAIVFVIKNLKMRFIDIAISLLGIIYVPFMMLFLLLTWHMSQGYLYTWFILGGAWVTDTFAYFVGSAIGKHKFSKISPNKSIEGCIGGILGCAIFYGVYSYYLNTNYLVEIGGTEFNLALMTILGACISVLSQLGDFFASGIKRQCEIKDYGHIMPGHGGVLDRFDSILMIAPVVYLLFEFIL